MAKIEEVKEMFDRWRSQKPGRRAVPIAMRQMVVDLIGEYTLTRICRDLNLTMSNVKKWKVRLAEDRAFLASGVGGTEMVIPGAVETKVTISESTKPLTHGVSFLELEKLWEPVSQPPLNGGEQTGSRCGLWER